MPAHFSRRANAVVRWTLAIVLVTPFLVVSGLLAWLRTPYATGERSLLEQPVPFDHRHHVADDLIDCRYCHSDVERGPLAGVPAADLCMGCHGQIWSDSELLQPVRESYFAGRPIAWRRVHRLPDFVFFDHAAHVNNGVGCETCHGRVDRMARVYQVETLTMSWCLDCHRDPGEHLRPLSAITEHGWTGRTPSERAGARLASIGPVRPSTDCTSCHR